MSGSGYARAGANGRLTLAVPSKGRLAEPALEICAAAGLSFESNDHALMVPCSNTPVDLLLVRASDIPEYVQDGVVHAGITGIDLIEESGARVETLAELGFARCSLEAAVPVDRSQRALEDLNGLRVATSHPGLASARLQRLGVSVELVPVSGSVEAAPRLGLADAVVDLVSTGSTMDANGLRRIGRLLESQAVLIAGAASIQAQRQLIDRLELMLTGVAAARRRRYLMMNAPTSALERIKTILPSMRAPSVLQLAAPGEIALHAAVDADDVWDLLIPLKEAGASSILVMPVERLVP
jgi:ATP phosphoribosyltransferase